MDLNLRDLIEWHRHQAAECRHDGEEKERAFHESAVQVLEWVRGA